MDVVSIPSLQGRVREQGAIDGEKGSGGRGNGKRYK